jgi:hypothetical protein
MLGLAACGTSDEVGGRRDTVQQGLRALDPNADPPPTIAQMRGFIPFAVSRTQGALVLLEQPKFDKGAFFVEAARNGPVMTLGSDAQSTISLHGPVLVATRGFGADLMSVDPGALPALLAARRPGSYARALRYLDGTDQTHSFPVDCTLARDPDQPSIFVEYCGSAELEFRNTFQMSADGVVTVSTQWHGPANGTLTLRHLR